MNAVDWTKHVVDVPELFSSRARAYEQCITAGPLIFVSGQVGYDGDHLVSDQFEDQVRQVFTNIGAACRSP